MNVIEIRKIGKRIEYPSSWEECSTEQILFIFKNAIALISGNISLSEFKIITFYHLAGIKRKKKHNRKDEMLTEEQRLRKYDNVARAAETVNFMFSALPGENIAFEFDCVQNLLPHIRLRGKKMYGPAEALLNITFWEYQVAYEYYREFIAEKEETALNNLCAVLYRPKRSGSIDDDIRIDFNPHECERRSKCFSSVAYEVKFFIFSWFAACDNYFKSSDLIVDGQSITLAPLFKSEGSSENDNLGLTAIMMGVADSGTFGNVDGVKRTNLYAVMLKLFLWYKENERVKKMYNDKRT